jgi:enoyl-CoA hydratase
MPDIVVETSGKIATVIIDRPPVNAITLAGYRQVAEIFGDLGRRSDVNCAVFTARGSKAFCAGIDLNEFKTMKVEDDPERSRLAREAFAAIRQCAIPVIGAINGPALGAGCVFSAVCDIRVASETATFGLPEINVGRCGGGAHVGRLIPQGALRLMFFTGQPISAADAYRLGFVDRLVPAGQALSAAMELAATIARKAPLGLRLGKEALNRAETLPVEEGYAVEQSYSAKLLLTEDCREATRAVLEKRAPVFQGR